MRWNPVAIGQSLRIGSAPLPQAASSATANTPPTSPTMHWDRQGERSPSGRATAKRITIKNAPYHFREPPPNPGSVPPLLKTHKLSTECRNFAWFRVDSLANHSFIWFRPIVDNLCVNIEFRPGVDNFSFSMPFLHCLRTTSHTPAKLLVSFVLWVAVWHPSVSLCFPQSPPIVPLFSVAAQPQAWCGDYG